MKKTALYISFLIASNGDMLNASGPLRPCVRTTGGFTMRTLASVQKPMPQQAWFTSVRCASLSAVTSLLKQQGLEQCPTPTQVNHASMTSLLGQQGLQPKLRLLQQVMNECSLEIEKLLHADNDESGQADSTIKSKKNPPEKNPPKNKTLAQINPVTTSFNTTAKQKIQALMPDLKQHPSPLGLKRENTSIVGDICDEFLKRVLSLATDSSINSKEVEALIELYRANVSRSKNAITKVLNGVTDGNGTETYQEVIAHIEERGSDIESYRRMYANVCDSFKGSFVTILNRVIDDMRRESTKKWDIRKLKREEHIDIKKVYRIIAECSNPLYPVNPDEIEKIFELYNSDINRSKNAITKVLNGVTDGNGTETYKEVVAHIENQGSDLDVYRDIYSRMSHALNGEALSFIYYLIQNG